MEVVEVLQQLYGLVSDDILYALLCLSVQNDLVDNLLDVIGPIYCHLARLGEFRNISGYLWTFLQAKVTGALSPPTISYSFSTR